MGLKGNILVAEDDPTIRKFIQAALADTDCSINCVGDGRTAVDAIKRSEYDLVFTDLRMPGLDGLQVLKNVKRLRPQINVVIGTAYGSVENAVEAMRMGAFDMLTKPFSKQDLVDVITRALEKPTESYTQQPVNAPPPSIQFIGESDAVQRIKSFIAKVASTSATVLIEGETGTGKEVIADALHYSSRRSKNKLVKINCAALPETLAESELFGHEKGAYTGALSRTRGRFELADGGTILLDEIGELSIPMQAKLLRVLQNKTFERLGSGQTVNVDTRIIATTNRDLRHEVKTGRFRKDLFFRLNVVRVKISPLRERTEDIPILANYFLKLFNERDGKNKRFASNVINEMIDYDWPGNVRELQNCIEKAIVTSYSDEIYLEDLQLHDEFEDFIDYLGNNKSNITIWEAEKLLVEKTLKKMANNKTKAADALGITVRTLRNKLHEYKEYGLANLASPPKVPACSRSSWTGRDQPQAENRQERNNE